MDKNLNTPKTLPQGRLHDIDTVKGLAIVLVVMGHILHADGDIVSKEADKLVADAIYAFHMPLFFFVTGFCRFLSEQKRLLDGKSLARQCGKLTARLLPCYLLWTLVYFLIRLATAPADPVTWLTITLTFRGVAPLWFLADLFLSELVFLVIQWAARGRWGVHAAAALLTGAGAVPLSHYMWNVYQAARDLAEETDGMEVVFDPLTRIVPYLQISLSRVVPTLFFLFCGYLAAKLLHQRRIASPVYLLLGCAGLCGAVTAQLQLGNAINLHLCVIEKPALFLFTGLSGSLGALLLCRGLCRLLPMMLLRSLGRNSLGIMVLHYPPMPTMELASALCLLMVPEVQQTPVQYLLLLTTLTVAICSLVTALIHRRLFL